MCAEEQTLQTRNKEEEEEEEEESASPSGESTLRPEDRLPLREDSFEGRVPKVDMDWEMFLCKLDLGANSNLSLDFFLAPGN